jgi:hypothetical protein
MPTKKTLKPTKSPKLSFSMKFVKPDSSYKSLRGRETSARSDIRKLNKLLKREEPGTPEYNKIKKEITIRKNDLKFIGTVIDRKHDEGY